MTDQLSNLNPELTPEDEKALSAWLRAALSDGSGEQFPDATILARTAMAAGGRRRPHLHPAFRIVAAGSLAASVIAASVFVATTWGPHEGAMTPGVRTPADKTDAYLKKFQVPIKGDPNLYPIPDLDLPQAPKRDPWSSHPGPATPPASGQDCQQMSRVGPEPVIGTQITRDKVTIVVTGWGQHQGAKLFADLVAGDGKCIWDAAVATLPHTGWKGDQGSLITVGRPGADLTVAAERVGDLIVAVTVDGSGAHPRSQAISLADDVTAQLRASGHPAATESMPVDVPEVKAGYVTPTPQSLAAHKEGSDPVPGSLGIPVSSLPKGYFLGMTISHGAKGWPAPGLMCDVAKPRTARATLGAREWEFGLESPQTTWDVDVMVTRWAPGTADNALRDLAADRAWCAWVDALRPVDSPLNKPGESWLARQGSHSFTLVRRHGDRLVGVQVWGSGAKAPASAQVLAVAQHFEQLQADRLD